MVINLLSVYSAKNSEEEQEVHIDMKSIKSKMGVFPIKNSRPFKLRFVNVENKRLLIQGELELTVSIPCDRCLKKVSRKLHLDIAKDIPMSDADGIEEAGLAETADDDQLEQMEYINGYQLDVDRLVYGEILPAWPMKVLCREDCRGICIKCGADLNQGDCGCERTALDPRMAAFQDVFNKFKEVEADVDLSKK